MTTPIRIGVIGTSWWADLVHLPYLTADARTQVVAICGRNRERAQSLATKYSIPQFFTDYRAMLAEGGLEAVVIATPDDEHYAMTMAALDAGLHVLCEKPLARTATQAQQMYERAEAQGVRHMTYFTWRWFPHYRYLHDLIAQGAVGRLYHAQFHFMAGNGRNPTYTWRFDPQRADGVLGDYGSHMIDLARYLIGDISRVHARLATHAPHNGLDGRPMDAANDAATLLVDFVNGGQGTIAVSAVARTHDPALEHTVTLHGEAGSLMASFGLFTTPPKVQLATGDNGFQELAIPTAYLSGLDPAQPVGPQVDALFRQPGMAAAALSRPFWPGRALRPASMTAGRHNG